MTKYPTFEVSLAYFLPSPSFYAEIKSNARVASMIIPPLLCDQHGLEMSRHKSGNCVLYNKHAYKVRAVRQMLSFRPSSSTGVGRSLNAQNWARGLDQIGGFAIYDLWTVESFFVSLVPLKVILEILNITGCVDLRRAQAKALQFIS